MQQKSALMASYASWPQVAGVLLEGSARPEFLGAMRTRALAIEASASGNNAYWAVYRQDGNTVDKDRYGTSGTANDAGYVPVIHFSNDDEHHLTGLPKRLYGMSGIAR
jgi:hypothetical protein